MAAIPPIERRGGFLARVFAVALCAAPLLGPIARAEEAIRFDTQRRAHWTTSKVKGSPDPQPPYRVVNAFGKLKFREPLEMAAAPGSNRLVVLERYGKLVAFPNDPQTTSGEVALELKEKVFYGFAFHPKFALNGQVFVTVVVNPSVPEEPLGTRVSRFTIHPDNPSQFDPKSEQVIIEWPSGGHNGGCLMFGPDGFLYIATGDASGIADEKLTGQDLASLAGKILRIDVDRRDGERNYSIPADNPFRDVAGARPEIWAYGLRQPWKISFDRETGELWTGNVGQDLWEQIFLVERGGNYGWSVMEGSHPFRPERKRGPSPFLPPIIEHDHAEFRSITGGFVYRGSRLPELKGSYVYGDYDSGKIWMLRYDPQSKRVTENRELVDSALRLVGFAEDGAGELYLIDHMGGTIHRLEQNPQSGRVADFPRRLSETGLFESTMEHRPAAGIIPYDVNAAQWCDGAIKQRYLGIPGMAKIEFDAITYPQPAPGAPHGWKFPDGTVVFETISMEFEPGNPASRRRLETRLLHYEQLAGGEDVGDQFWRGYTYLWNEQQSDAVLLEEPLGKDIKLSIQDRSAPGGRRTQTWHAPGRAECIVCHNMAAKYVLGINTLQSNRTFHYASGTENQLTVFDRLGLFTKPLEKAAADEPRLVDYHDAAEDLNDRARSYLHANCSHCHRKWGGGNAEFRLSAIVPLDEVGIINTAPAHGAFYITDAKLLAPGDPTRSVLYYRMAKLGAGRMPRLGSSVVDESGLRLIRQWIAAQARVADPKDQVAAALRNTPTADARAKLIDEQLATTNGALRLALALEEEVLDGSVRAEIVARATNQSAAHVRDLFERYVPEEQRIKRLGNVVRPEQILAITGDAGRGRTLFFEAADVQCKNCHKVAGKGGDVGPDLAGVGKRFPDRTRLLDTILNPSREIDPKYRGYLLLTTDGQVLTGLLVKRDEKEVILRDAKGVDTRVAAAQVEELTAQQQSLMPELLVRDLTEQQVADILAFLSSLRETP